MTTEDFQKEIRMGIPDTLPEKPVYDTTVNHAPKRKDILTQEQKKLALRNALRYFPEHLHRQLAPEFVSTCTDTARSMRCMHVPSTSILPAVARLPPSC